MRRQVRLWRTSARTYTGLSTLGPHSLRRLAWSSPTVPRRHCAPSWTGRLSIFGIGSRERQRHGCRRGSWRRLLQSLYRARRAGNAGIARAAPRALAGTPGVEGRPECLYDFNLKTAALTLLQPAHPTRIDGRDPSLPHCLGSVDWAALSLTMDDIDHSSSCGSSCLRSTAPAPSRRADVDDESARQPRRQVLYTVGELGTQSHRVPAGVPLGHDWYLKAIGGYHRSSDSTRSASRRRVRAGDPAARSRAPTLGNVRLYSAPSG